MRPWHGSPSGPRFRSARRATCWPSAPTPGSELHVHQKGFDADEAARVAERVLAVTHDELPEHWLRADVTSARNDYGRLVAVLPTRCRSSSPAERDLLDVYAR
jgi:hypothetical protein